jgi:hypothetical protein
MSKYKIKSFLFIAYVCFALATFAQPSSAIQWQKSLGGSLDDFATCIQQTADGGYIVGGYTMSPNDGDVTGNHGSSDFWIVKLNATGDTIWKKSLGGSGVDEAYSIQQTADGGYIVAGTSNSPDGDVTGNNGGDYWIVKLNETGDITWEKSLGGLTDDATATSVKQTTDGGYIIAGYSGSNDGNVTGNHGGNDYWIVKLNSTGNIIWEKSLGGTDDDRAYSVQQTTDGGYIVAGGSKSNNGNPSGNHGIYDYWIVKLDNAGSVTWQKSIGGGGEDVANSISQTADGGYIVAGYSNSIDDDITGNHGTYDYWIVKLDNAGNITWQKSLGGTNTDIAKSIKQTADGGYIVGGYTSSDDGDVSGTHGSAFGHYDYWLVKLDNVGNLTWQKTLGGVGYEYAQDVLQTSDGNYIMAGYTGSVTGDGDVLNNHGNFDYWIVKLDAVVLPITLISFTAQKQHGTILLTWQTASEQNNKEYQIERSADGVTFNTIEVVASKNNLSGSHYTSVDAYPLFGRNYYRLKSVDIDGKFSYSNIDEVTFNLSTNNVIVYPNPAKDVLTVQSNFKGEKLNIRITDLAGRKILQTIKQNNQLIEIPTSDLRAGFYLLKINDGITSVSKKIIKE